MRVVPKTLHSTREGLFIVFITNISVLLSRQESLNSVLIFLRHV